MFQSLVLLVKVGLALDNPDRLTFQIVSTSLTGIGLPVHSDTSYYYYLIIGAYIFVHISSFVSV